MPAPGICVMPAPGTCAGSSHLMARRVMILFRKSAGPGHNAAGWQHFEFRAGAGAECHGRGAGSVGFQPSPGLLHEGVSHGGQLCGLPSCRLPRRHGHRGHALAGGGALHARVSTKIVSYRVPPKLLIFRIDRRLYTVYINSI